MPDTFDGAQASAAVGSGIVFAYNLFVDGGGNNRGMMHSSLCLPDGAGYSEVDAANPMPITAAALPLPTGAATAAAQATGNASVASIDGKITTCNTGAVTVAGSALPTGASTFAEQQSQTTQLTRVAGKYVDFDTGAGSDSVVAIGLLLPASGGAVIGGTASNPIRIDPTGSTPQPITAASLPLPSNAAVETGGNLAAIATSLNVLDDFDEADRCKVNLIVGQAGISAGAGAVDATTPRVTHASDDPAVSSLATISTQTSSLNGKFTAGATPADGAANSVNTTRILSMSLLYNGTTWDRMRGDTTNGVDVDVTRLRPDGTNTLPAGDTAARAIHANLNLAGTAVDGNSGNKSNGTVRTVIATDQPTLTNLIGKIASGEDAKLLYDGTTSLTVKHANIDTATSGNNELVAAVAGKVLRVVSVFLAASGAVDVYFNDGTANLLGGTRKIKLDNTGAAGAVGFALQENGKGWFKTAAANRPLILNLSGAVGVAGCVSYVEADA
jgi:hypothetical protein